MKKILFVMLYAVSCIGADSSLRRDADVDFASPEVDAGGGVTTPARAEPASPALPRKSRNVSKVATMVGPSEALKALLRGKTSKEQCSFLIENFEKYQHVGGLSDLQNCCLGLAADVAAMKPRFHMLMSKVDVPVDLTAHIADSLTAQEIIEALQDKKAMKELSQHFTQLKHSVKKTMLLVPYEQLVTYERNFKHYYDVLVAKRVLRDPLVLGRLMNMRDYLHLTYESPYNNLSDPYFVRSH